MVAAMPKGILSSTIPNFGGREQGQERACNFELRRHATRPAKMSVAHFQALARQEKCHWTTLFFLLGFITKLYRQTSETTTSTKNEEQQTTATASSHFKHV